MKRHVALAVLAGLLVLVLTGCMGVSHLGTETRASVLSVAAQVGEGEASLSDLATVATGLDSQVAYGNGVLCQYDANGNDRLDDDEVTNLVRDWIEGKEGITDDVILTGIAAWVNNAKLGCSQINTTISRSYSWNCSYPDFHATGTLTTSTPQATYDLYHNAVHTENFTDYDFINSTYAHVRSDDDVIKMLEIRIPHGDITTSEHFQNTLCFVQDSIKYASDPPEGYIRYPLETYIDGKGDCEDQALLLASLLKEEGYTMIWVWLHPKPGATWPNGTPVEAHMVTAMLMTLDTIQAWSDVAHEPVSYVTFEGQTYLILEATRVASPGTLEGHCYWDYYQLDATAWTVLSKGGKASFKMIPGVAYPKTHIKDAEQGRRSNEGKDR